MTDFSNLPVGTMMVVTQGFTGSYLKPIEKVMKRHIVCGGVKWQIDGWNSMANAGRWSRASIRVATPDDIAAIQHGERAYSLSNVKWATMPIGLVREVFDKVFTEAKP